MLVWYRAQQNSHLRHFYIFFFSEREMEKMTIPTKTVTHHNHHLFSSALMLSKYT